MQDSDETFIIRNIQQYEEVDKPLSALLLQIFQSYGFQLKDHSQFDDLERKIRESAISTSGSELSDTELQEISKLAQQAEPLLTEKSKIRGALRERMILVAPRVYEKLGEVVGARMIQKFGLENMINQE